MDWAQWRELPLPIIGEERDSVDGVEVSKQLADRHVELGLVGLAAYLVSNGEGGHAVEGVNPDFLVGSVEHRVEGDDPAVFRLTDIGPTGAGRSSAGPDTVGSGQVDRRWEARPATDWRRESRRWRVV